MRRFFGSRSLPFGESRSTKYEGALFWFAYSAIARKSYPWDIESDRNQIFGVKLSKHSFVNTNTAVYSQGKFFLECFNEFLRDFLVLRSASLMFSCFVGAIPDSDH